MDREAVIPIVDDQDRVIGTALRSEMRAHNLLHRCTAVLVLNGPGTELLVQQRSSTKALWASWWDIATGGVLEVDEELDDAAARELVEELGVSASLTKLGSARHTDAEVDVFMHVWLARHDGPFVFADGEVAQVRWLTPSDLHHMLHGAGYDWCRDSLSVALPMLQRHDSRWQFSS
jgi:isopentenyldiphosphate isomerase